MPKCPICPHEAKTYETLFNHLIHHKKADIVTALLKNMELMDTKLSHLEKAVAFLKKEVENRAKT